MRIVLEEVMSPPEEVPEERLLEEEIFMWNIFQQFLFRQLPGRSFLARMTLYRSLPLQQAWDYNLVLKRAGKLFKWSWIVCGMNQPQMRILLPPLQKAHLKKEPGDAVQHLGNMVMNSMRHDSCCGSVDVPHIYEHIRDTFSRAATTAVVRRI